jgi:MinD-like ATPase involved in chromosome partitioning or flagellar assembly
VILSGREGTGKSKMCLEIASLCEEKDEGVIVVVIIW